jgi:signal transduction histidine kinase
MADRQRLETTERAPGARMLLVLDEERRRVARELHADFSQRLALLAIDLEQLAGSPPKSRPEWDDRLRTMCSRTQDLASDAHRLSHQLHPSNLENLGLVAAVRSYCREITRQTNVAVGFSEANPSGSLPSEVQLALYRILQEALRNVIKHSGSKTAQVELKGEANAICLVVSDSGKGIAVEVAKETSGLGLVSMQERARLVGDAISIGPSPSGGARVEVRIPLEPI